MKSFVIVLSAVGTAIACAPRQFHDEAETLGWASGVDSGPILARLHAAADMFAVQGANEDPGRSLLCRLQPQAVAVEKFQAGKFRIRTEGAVPCKAGDPRSFRGWVDASAVTIEGSAYAGKLTEVQSNSAISVKMNYAGNKIFCTNGDCKIREPLYGTNRCLLRDNVNGLLQNAAIILKRDAGTSYKLQILDCYRPVYVQERMARLVSDRQWVAQPVPGRYGGHNGGIAVDLTLEKDGIAVDMGSGFDEFHPRSHFDAPGISPAARRNRELLKRIMKAAGFKDYPGEWWHFSLDHSAPEWDGKIVPFNLAL